MTFLVWAGAVGGAMWLALLALPWRPWGTSERIDADEHVSEDTDLSDVTVLIPARDEAAEIGDTLRALAAQGRDLEVVVIDDQSVDGTAEVARAAGLPNLKVIAGTDLPAGWKHFETKNFMVVYHTSKNKASRYSKQAEACWKWLDKNFGKVGDQHVCKCILRVCKNWDEEKIYRTRTPRTTSSTAVASTASRTM